MAHTFLNFAYESFFRNLRQSGPLANAFPEPEDPLNPCRTIMRIQERILETLRALKPELSEKFGVATIGLFGSVNREDFRPESSDMDIIVEFSRPVGLEFIDLACFLESKINRKIDLVSRKGIKMHYLEAIEKNMVYV
jgi:uncharacterized protein